jgi:Mce-associated membrane protein
MSDATASAGPRSGGTGVPAVSGRGRGRGGRHATPAKGQSQTADQRRGDLQLLNGSQDDIVGPVASGFWTAIAEELDRTEQGVETNKQDEQKAKTGVLTRARSAKTVRPHPSVSEPEEPNDDSDSSNDSLDGLTGVSGAVAVEPGVSEAALVEAGDSESDEDSDDGSQDVPVVAAAGDDSVEQDEAEDDSVEQDEAEAGAKTKLFTRVRRALRANLKLVLLGIVTVGLAVALVLTGLSLSNRNSLEKARSSALASAKTYGVEIGSYSYKTLDHDFGQVVSNSTSSFGSHYAQASAALKATLLKYHASSKATVVAAGIVSATTTTATVMVFLDQNVTNTVQKGTTTDRTQVEINEVLQNGKWRISNVTIL